MQISEIKIFRLDIEKSTIDIIDHTQYGADFDTYLQGLIRLITSGSSGRNFCFDRDTTEVRAQISRLLAREDFGNIAGIITNRLLTVEQDTHTRMTKMGVEIQKGIVVQALVNENGTNKFVICKAEHNDFLNEINFTISKGLPIKKKVFKAFICSLNYNAVDEVLVYDTNPNLSNYWWKEFLELSKVYSDEDNTENAFEAIDKSVFTKMKKDYPQDYTYLRNSTVRYFRASQSFDMQDYLDTAIGDYTPYNDKLNVENIKAKVRELPGKNRKPFDEQFTIVKEKIKARFSNRIQLTTQIDLYLKEDIPNINNVITAVQDPDGTKYVKIKSEEGYKYFNNL